MKDNKFDGQLAYAYAKRGQVILAERWAKDKTHEPVKVVTAHPGKQRSKKNNKFAPNSGRLFLAHHV